MDEGEADSGIEMVAGGCDPDSVPDVAASEIENQPERKSTEKIDGDSGSKAASPESEGDAAATSAVDEDANVVFIRVFIHDQNLQRCYKFHLDEVVFNAKKKVAAL